MQIHPSSAQFKTSPRFLQWIGWLLIAIGLLLMLTWLRSPIVASPDFVQDYKAAQALRAGCSIYALSPVQNSHPPFDALLFVPLTLLPYSVATLLWSVVSLLLYLWIGCIILHELSITLARHWMVLLIGLALCWYPFQVHVALGQLSLLVTACLIGGWALLRRQRDGLAGLLLGLACLIKLFPVLIVPILLLRRRWRAAGAALATVACGGLVTLLIVGPNDLSRYVWQVAPLDIAEFAAFPVNASLTGTFSRLFVEGLWVCPLVNMPPVASLLTTLSSLGLLGLLVFEVWRMPTTPRGDDNAFALACLAMLLLSPITWQHSFPVLALPFGLLFRDLQERPRAHVGTLGPLALAWVLVSLPDVQIAQTLMFLYAPNCLPWFTALVFMAPTAGLLLLGWLVGRSRTLGANDGRV